MACVETWRDYFLMPHEKAPRSSSVPGIPPDARTSCLALPQNCRNAAVRRCWPAATTPWHMRRCDHSLINHPVPAARLRSQFSPVGRASALPCELRIGGRFLLDEEEAAQQQKVVNTRHERSTYGSMLVYGVFSYGFLSIWHRSMEGPRRRRVLGCRGRLMIVAQHSGGRHYPLCSLFIGMCVTELKVFT